MAGSRPSLEPIPLLSRLRTATTVAVIQNVVMRPSAIMQSKTGVFHPPEIKPDVVKKYRSHPGIHARVFFPPSHNPDSPTALPALFTVHGGGFFSGAPRDTDHLNSRYATSHNIIVISLSYTLAPAGAFPKSIHQIGGLILSAIDDQTLPIDPQKVFLLGWSAGASLALAAAQLPALQGKLAGVIPFYPPTDWTMDKEEKLLARRWKPSLAGFRGRPVDRLSNVVHLSEWAYVSPGQDLLHPMLSSCFAARETLPKNVFVVGAELDVLAWDGWRLAWKLAGRKGELGLDVGKEEPGPPGELILDDDRFYFEENGVTWLLVPDAIHAFDMDLLYMTHDPESQQDGWAKSDKVVKMVGEWIHRVAP